MRPIDALRGVSEGISRFVAKPSEPISSAEHANETAEQTLRRLGIEGADVRLFASTDEALTPGQMNAEPHNMDLDARRLPDNLEYYGIQDELRV